MSGKIRRQCYYDARVNDINLEDITSSEKNANILRALRDEGLGKIYLVGGNDSRECDFVIREGDDLGWLGYFIGRTQYLRMLAIIALPENRERIDALVTGIVRNKSIQIFFIATAQPLQELERFFGSNKNISLLTFCSFNIGRECAHSIASSLRQMQWNSIKNIAFMMHNSINEEGFEEICGALRSHPQLELLDLEGSNIGRNGCEALGKMFSSWHAPNLKHLDLVGNSIDDTCIRALLEGMLNCCDLEIVKLSGNRSITSAGLRSLSTLFQSRSCALEELHLERMNIGDDGAAALAEGLVGNKSLKQLYFNVDSSGITEIGWSAFSKLLCDTSSINNTYLSNHTLERIGEDNGRGAPGDVLAEHLVWNSFTDANEHDVAIWKILRHFDDYNDLDIESLFRWKLKLLPLLVVWFKRARSSIAPRVTNSNVLEEFEKRKLSAVHKFVRGMPLLIIDGYNSRRTNTRLSRKRRLDGEAK